MKIKGLAIVKMSLHEIYIMLNFVSPYQWKEGFYIKNKSQSNKAFQQQSC